MEDFEKILKFMRRKGVFTVPELQLEFGLGYPEVRKIVRGFRKDNTIEEVEGGLRLKQPNPENPVLFWDCMFEEERIEFVKQRFKSCAKIMNRQKSDFEIDEIALKALWFCIETDGASIFLLQRKMDLRLDRATKIIEWMEHMGYISKRSSLMNRKMLVCKAEYIFTYGEPDEPQLKSEFLGLLPKNKIDGED